MGYRFQDQCFETKQEFMNMLSQTCMAPSGTAGLSSYFTVCTPNTDTITIQAYLLSKGTPQVPFNITPPLIACDFPASGVLGLSTLPWSDVSLLISALILSCSLAVGFNIISKQFYRG